MTVIIAPPASARARPGSAETARASGPARRDRASPSPQSNPDAQGDSPPEASPNRRRRSSLVSKSRRRRWSRSLLGGAQNCSQPQSDRDPQAPGRGRIPIAVVSNRKGSQACEPCRNRNKQNSLIATKLEKPKLWLRYFSVLLLSQNLV